MIHTMEAFETEKAVGTLGASMYVEEVWIGSQIVRAVSEYGLWEDIVPIHLSGSLNGGL